MKNKKLLGSLLAVVILLLASFFGLDVDIPEAAEPVNPGEYVQEVAKDNLQLDPDGSYTGCPLDGGKPVQDADDL